MSRVKAIELFANALSSIDQMFYRETNYLHSRRCESDISTAENGASEANKELGEAIIKKDMTKIQEAQAKITMALDAKKRWRTELEDLQARKRQKK